MNEKDVGPVLPEKEAIQVTPSGLIIPYKEFKCMPTAEIEQIPPGTLVQNVKANELYTDQGWLEIEKAIRAISDFKDGRCLTHPIGYPKNVGGRPALVLGEGNHRSGYALVNGFNKGLDIFTAVPRHTINIAIVRPLRAIIRQYPDIFHLWRHY